MSFILLGILNSQVAGGAAGAYDLLETQILTSSAASVTFTGLASYSNYKHLQIRALSKNDLASNGNDLVQLNVNGDTGSNYASHRLFGNGAGVTSTANTSDTKINIYSEPYTGVPAYTGMFAAAVIDVLDFSSTSKKTTFRSLAGFHIPQTNSSQIGLYSGLYNSTSAITTITLKSGSSANLVTGSRFSLYGVR